MSFRSPPRVAANTTYTLATAVLPLDENTTETLQNAHQALHNALVNLEAYVATHPECARAVQENFTAVFQGACGPSMVMEEHMVTAMVTALGIFVVFMLTCMLR
ncbi:uncharacterized protein MYCGRDRAFT_97756 [Zymoseptoria tritici IPO323]|uniref:Uncharacterized protein n=1 Tax=Zymoseptoria tritici (strain CBS 115943 / IPO323) TaxID=336722 RepID=F9XR97_ZYMTI|nr:uncharacterized protein MYCGRDRAFT_97756 [Zymoseptoria tritici IPO323]EGP82249.1 hypothetical protein MYCGRDRAFT_97756 [Zymoseptoria tritici IPO323]